MLGSAAPCFFSCSSVTRAVACTRGCCTSSVHPWPSVAAANRVTPHCHPHHPLRQHGGSDEETGEPASGATKERSERHVNGREIPACGGVFFSSLWIPRIWSGFSISLPHPNAHPGWNSRVDFSPWWTGIRLAPLPSSGLPNKP